MREAWDMGEAVRCAIRSRLPAGLAVTFPPEETLRIRRRRQGAWRVWGEAQARSGGLRLTIRFCALVRQTPAGWRVCRVDMATSLAERES
ncbi:MAG: hypothetical protein ACI4ML_10165 [Aristaeellaceae bacterium]